MSKHFLVNPSIIPVSKEGHESIQKDREERWKTISDFKESINESFLAERETLQCVPGKVIVKVDTQSKNYHEFESGLKIRRERQFNEFNRRITEPTNAIVISSEYIPAGSEILISHNALHETNRIFNYRHLSGKNEATDIRYFSIHERDCFAWLDDKGGLKPLRNFEFALRLFSPYKGLIDGIEPTAVKDVLFVKTGDLKGLVVNVLTSSDYTIIYQGRDGKEKQEIRFRHSLEDFDMEEVICINHELTERVRNGELLIGIEANDAKQFEINAYAD